MSNKVLVIGAQNIDIFTKTKEPYTLHDSNVCQVSMAFGGVGRNIVENLVRLENDVAFLTVFSQDYFGQIAKQSLIDMGVKLDHSLVQEGLANSIYLGILDDKNDLYLGLNDMAIIDYLNQPYLDSKIEYINSFDYVVIDNNLPEESIAYLLKESKGIKIMDAVSAHKIHKIAPYLEQITYLKINQIEYDELKRNLQSINKEIPNTLKLIVTNGEQEIRFFNGRNPLKAKPITCNEIINASGAGDGFISGFVHGLLQHKNEVECLEYAKRVAFITLQSNDATNKSLSKEEVEDETIY